MEGSKKAYRVQYPDEYITDTGMMHTGYRYALNRRGEGVQDCSPSVWTDLLLTLVCLAVIFYV